MCRPGASTAGVLGPIEPGSERGILRGEWRDEGGVTPPIDSTLRHMSIGSPGRCDPFRLCDHRDLANADGEQ